MTTPPVTREIEARLKQIAAEERSKITAARNTVSFMLQNDAATLESMRRAYSLAGEDGVRSTDIVELRGMAADIRARNEDYRNPAIASAASEEYLKFWDNRADVLERVAARSAVLIPREEVETP